MHNASIHRYKCRCDCSCRYISCYIDGILSLIFSRSNEENELITAEFIKMNEKFLPETIITVVHRAVDMMQL